MCALRGEPHASKGRATYVAQFSSYLPCVDRLPSRSLLSRGTLIRRTLWFRLLVLPRIRPYCASRSVTQRIRGFSFSLLAASACVDHNASGIKLGDRCWHIATVVSLIHSTRSQTLGSVISIYISCPPSTCKKRPCGFEKAEKTDHSR